MSNVNQEEMQIQLSIDQAKGLIMRRDALRALEQNPYWKTLITECYFKTEPVRLVMLKSDENAQTPEMQEAIDKDISAIGALRQFFGATIQLGNSAEATLQSHRDTLDSVRNGDDISEYDVDELGE